MPRPHRLPRVLIPVEITIAGGLTDARSIRASIKLPPRPALHPATVYRWFQKTPLHHLSGRS